MINNTPALKNNLEITDQSVCVTEEESVCGEKSSYCFRLPQGNFKEQCRKEKTWLEKGEGNANSTELWGPWNVYAADMNPLSLCGQFCYSPSLTDTEQTYLSLYYSMGAEG